MGVAGWWPEQELEELPGSQHARSIMEILSAPSSRFDRDQLRAERQAEADRRDRAADAVAAAGNMAFAAMVAGRPGTDPFVAARAEPFRDQQAAVRRRSAIEILKAHGLSDVITGGDSGCVIDPNLGVLEPERDTAERDRMNFAYESGRSEREAAANTAYVNRSRARLDERLRVRGMAPSGSRRSRSVSDQETYERACREIGESAGDDPRPVSHR